MYGLDRARRYLPCDEKMKYQIKKANKSDYNTSTWSGGTTTEIRIMPEDSRYADREFLWRLSSATVEVEESTFTALPDYDRLIMMLEGEMDLCHNHGPWIHLAEFEPHAFDGGDETLSKGKVVDFNLMLRKGKCRGAVVPVVFSAKEPEGAWEVTSGNMVPELKGCRDCMIYCHCGPLYIMMEDGSERELKAGESLQMAGDFKNAEWKFRGENGVRAVIAAVWNV